MADVNGAGAGSSEESAGPSLSSLFASEIAAGDAETEEEGESQDETTDEESGEESEDAEGSDEETEESDPEGDEADEDGVELDFETKSIPVVVDGKEEMWSIEDLRKSASREGKWTQKMQALAEKERSFEQTVTAHSAEREAVSRKAAEYAELLPQVRKALETLQGNEPDWAEARRTMAPGDYAAARQDWDDRQKRFAALKSEEDKVRGELQTNYQKGLQEYATGERKKLFAAVPEWNDAKVAKAELDEIQAHAISRGWTQDDLANTIDHRAVLALRDSWKLAKMLGKKPALKAKIKLATKPAGSTTTGKAKVAVSKLTQQSQRLAKSGSVQDAGALFSSLIEAEETPRKRRR